MSNLKNESAAYSSLRALKTQYSQAVKHLSLSPWQIIARNMDELYALNCKKNIILKLDFLKRQVQQIYIHF